MAYLGAAACSVAIALFWSRWQWPGTCVFALVLVALAWGLEKPIQPQSPLPHPSV